MLKYKIPQIVTLTRISLALSHRKTKRNERSIS